MTAREHETARKLRIDQDEQHAAREWADEQAAWIGGIWARRFPQGQDWEGDQAP